MDEELFPSSGGEGQYQRRLPLYLLLDTLLSMRQNQAIDGLRQGMEAMVESLRAIPEARNGVHIKVIEFSDHVNATALTPLLDFTPPSLEANGSATYLGMALRRLDEDARFGHDLIENSSEHKGDFAPIVLLLTDGQPNDPDGRFEAAAATIKERVRRKEMNVVAVALGADASPAALAQITDTILPMRENTLAQMESLFQWVTASVAQRSISASHHVGPGDPPPTAMEPPPPGIVLWNGGAGVLDDLVRGNAPAGGQQVDQQVGAGSDGDRVPSDTRPMGHVMFTNYCPREVAEHVWEPLLVYIALDTPEAAAQVDESASERLGSRKGMFRAPHAPSLTSLCRGVQLTILPRLHGFRVNPPFMNVEWVEDTQCHEFRIQADGTPPGQSVNGSILFLEGPILRGELPLSVFVDNHRKHRDSRDRFGARLARGYRNTFPSYSRKDEWIVRAFESMAEASGDRFLRDIRALRAGQEWRPAVLELINQADVFQLFWSKASAVSPEVEHEWRHALTLLATKPNFIRPVYWGKLYHPPAVLRDIDFGYVDIEALGMTRTSWINSILRRT